MKRMCLFVTCCFFIFGLPLCLKAEEAAVTQKDAAAAKPATTQMNEPKKEPTPNPVSKPDTKTENSQDMSVIPKGGAGAEPPKAEMYVLDTEATLKAVPKSDTIVEIHLANKGPISGLQFSLLGASITSVRTASRAAEFLAKFNQANGTVIMISLSQTPIPPGDGPILEAVCEKARSATLSDIKLIKSNAPQM